ncbi:phage portal protein [Pseudooceanicola sp. CBS1P-1]|uniref:Phage portal protein n=1 Tax=Pseudooceanicola albus TaxID=2692189 RepID=A0A6L7G4N0_9RHOB|nr:MULTISPECIES: phage portal protein [Pseudooceanicola]MBT9385629.1 phage portal protein [Pseudooceanicola endophyticus]MXN18961.1 phage portal protein [Pseudooceanicola albus]
MNNASTPLANLLGVAVRTLNSLAPLKTLQGNSNSQGRRSFDGATARRASGLGHFGSANAEIAAGHAQVSSRASYLAANNGYVSNGVTNIVTYLAGTGPRPNVRGESREVTRSIHRRFDSFSADADFHGRTDLGGLIAQITRDMVVHGEGLAILHDIDTGLKIQVIPPQHLDGSKSVNLSDGRQIVQGVEFDAKGRRVAYWIFPEHPSAIFTAQAASVRVDAWDVLHVFHPFSAGQVRGLSWLAPAILPANDLNAWKDALLVGAKMGAMQAGFITEASDTGGDEDVFSDPIWEPGSLTRLPLGATVTFTAPDQIKDAPALLRMTLQEIAAALGLPEFLLSGDLTSANYSSLRAGLIPFRSRMEQVQYATLVPQLLRPVWRRWLLTEMLSGQSDTPIGAAADWIFPRPQQVDPAKDLAATEKALSMGLTSRTAAINELGWNADDIDEEIKADRDREADLGLGFTKTEKPNAA